MEPQQPRDQLAWLDHPNPLVRWGGRAWLFVGLLLVGWALWRVAGIVRIVLVPLVIALFPAGVSSCPWSTGWRRVGGAAGSLRSPRPPCSC